MGERAPIGRSLDLLPVALLLGAALVREARPVALLVLLGGFAVGWRMRRAWAPAWAGAVPIAVSLAVGLAATPAAAADGSDCANPASPPAVWRAVEAILALSILAVLVRIVGARPSELGLTRASRRGALLATLGFMGAGPLALVLGPAFAHPFFGGFEIDLGQPGALVPALLLAISNALMEELAYRGALQGWLARTRGIWTAVALQALVFGAAHTGPDFIGSPLPVAFAMVAAGFAAGAIVAQTRSLTIPLALHVALDIPIYYWFACRLS